MQEKTTHFKEPKLNQQLEMHILKWKYHIVDQIGQVIQVIKIKKHIKLALTICFVILMFVQNAILHILIKEKYVCVVAFHLSSTYLTKATHIKVPWLWCKWDSIVCIRTMNLDQFQESIGGISSYQTWTIIISALLVFGSAYTPQSAVYLSGVPEFW